uniref:flagellar basal body L-ring protein FlgH n=1 Tax=Polynucleobacter sp. TaxID=2029855 RepID=UPI0040478A90
MKYLILITACATTLIGCAGVAPSTITSTSASVRPMPAERALPMSGAIYTERTYRSMFEDRRASKVGDVITIMIAEKSSTNKINNTKSENTGSAVNNLGALGGLSASAMKNANVKSEGERTLESTDTGKITTAFNSSLTVTVVDVLEGGNLVVQGEKQIGYDRGADFIRFSGIVSPQLIAKGNVISSTQVADARIEYRTNAQVDQSVIASMMNRLFYSILPF